VTGTGVDAHDAPDDPLAGLAAHDLLRTLVEATPPRLALPAGVRDPSRLRPWQAQLREALWGVLGVTPEPPAEVAARRGEAVDGEGFTRFHLTYAGAFGGTVTAYLLVPARRGAGPTPGLLCLHGHGANLGKAHVAGVPPDEEAAAYSARLNYDFAVRFARQGYVTLVPDALGFGERAPDKSSGYHAATGLVAEYLGLSLTGLRLLDDRRGLSVLAALPEVDASRLGAVGLSEGGKRTLFLTALDERVRVAVVSGYFTALRQEVLTWRRFYGWDLCNHLFGLLRVCDLPDVAALVAPRPLLIQNGRHDRLYGVAEVEAGFAVVQRAYGAAGAPAACALDLFDGEHVFMPPAAERWLAQWLQIF
jgi:dienelactone hydrolase